MARARHLTTVVLLTLTVAATLVALAVPVSAQQLVDAGKEGGQGGLAFVLMAAMFGTVFAVLFSMDRIRKRREREREGQPTS